MSGNPMHAKLKRVIPAIILLAVVYFGSEYLGIDLSRTSGPAAVSTGNTAVHEAFKAKQSDVIVTGEGMVTKVLPDDNEGSRHQRFIVDVGSNRTILIAHNIDLAARIPNLKAGDTVAFKGEYEYNPKGGVVHWTHHDPRGKHEAGWVKRK